MKSVLLVMSLFLGAHFAHSQQAEKVVLIEMGYGTYCSPCFHSKENLRQAALDYPGQVICAHYGEEVISSEQVVVNSNGTSSPLSHVIFDEFDLTYQTGTMVDRTTRPSNFIDYGGMGVEELSSYDISAMVDQQLLVEPPVGISISHTYNEVTRQLDAQVTVDFVQNASGDMGIYFFLTQDDVIAVGHNQVIPSKEDAYSYGYTENDIDSTLNGLGTYFYKIKDYKHPYVVKYIASGVWGNDGVISTSALSGETFSETFSYSLPEYTSPDDLPWNSYAPLVLPEDIRLVAAVVKYGPAGDRQILNAGTVELLNSSANVVENELEGSFSIISNPISGDLLIVNFDESKMQDGSFTVYSMSGNIVLETSISQQDGSQKIIDVSKLKSGMYMCNYHSGNSNYTQKITIL